MNRKNEKTLVTLGDEELSTVAGAGDIVNSGNPTLDASEHFQFAAGGDIVAFGSFQDKSLTKLTAKYYDSFNVVTVTPPAV